MTLESLESYAQTLESLESYAQTLETLESYAQTLETLESYAQTLETLESYAQTLETLESYAQTLETLERLESVGKLLESWLKKLKNYAQKSVSAPNTQGVLRTQGNIYIKDFTYILIYIANTLTFVPKKAGIWSR